MAEDMYKARCPYCGGGVVHTPYGAYRCNGTCGRDLTSAELKWEAPTKPKLVPQAGSHKKETK